MATPIKSLFPPIEKKPFLLNKQKSGSRRPTSCIDRMATPLGTLGLSQLLVFAFHLLFLIAIYFWAFILFALFILCNIYCDSFQFSIVPHACMFIYLCLHTLHGEPKKKKSSGPELVLFQVRKERFKWQVWLMSTDAHLDFCLDCNSPYATSTVESFSPTHVE